MWAAWHELSAKSSCGTGESKCHHVQISKAISAQGISGLALDENACDHVGVDLLARTSSGDLCPCGLSGMAAIYAHVRGRPVRHSERKSDWCIKQSKPCVEAKSKTGGLALVADEI